MKRLSTEEHRDALQLPKVQSYFGGLLWIGAILNMAGILVIVLSVIAGIIVAAPVMGVRQGDLVTGLAVGIGGIVAGLLVIAFAQLIEVQVARERNQRVTNALLLELLRHQNS